MQGELRQISDSLCDFILPTVHYVFQVWSMILSCKPVSLQCQLAKPPHVCVHTHTETQRASCCRKQEACPHLGASVENSGDSSSPPVSAHLSEPGWVKKNVYRSDSDVIDCSNLLFPPPQPSFPAVAANWFSVCAGSERLQGHFYCISPTQCLMIWSCSTFAFMSEHKAVGTATTCCACPQWRL